MRIKSLNDILSSYMPPSARFSMIEAHLLEELEHLPVLHQNGGGKSREDRSSAPGR